MRQVLQSLSTGETILAEVPCPALRAGHLLIQSRATLVSLGTERMLIEFGRSGLLEKARKQPEKVKQVLDKIRTDGLLPTIDAVRAKLDQPLPLGYCNAGVVVESSAGESGGFNPGDRVVSNGPHAEMVVAAKNLCARIPDSVLDEEAAFTVVASIGLQGIRLIGPTLGEAIVVTGLGLIGLLAVQMLKANGCRVLGIDYDSSKCALARQFGAETVDLSKGEDPVTAALAFSNGIGVDGVVITASTKSNEPVHQAALMCRKRGRIVLVGVTGLQLSRADFYEKELSFQVSCSYGPGRYDETYEQLGLDYPIGFVRWTEQRNFEAVLQMMSEKKLNLQPLISHRFSFDEALGAYNTETLGKALGIILQYPKGKEEPNVEPRLMERTVPLPSPPVSSQRAPLPHRPVVGLIGAGNYTGQVLLPALAQTGASLKVIASAQGVTAQHFGKKFGFATATTDLNSIFNDSDLDTIILTTRHSSHARYVMRAMDAGKNVFVEKPLCVRRAELEEIVARHSALIAKGAKPFVMVGFNRRFAPHVVQAKKLLAAVQEPKTFIMTVNAGAIPANHWTQQAGEGGRILGEGCHFIDLLRHLAGARIIAVNSSKIGPHPATPVRDDKMTITLQFEDGSLGVIHYFANGHKSFPKERLEIFCAGRVLQLDNFRILRGFGWPGFSKSKLWRQNKGHQPEMKAFIDAISGNEPCPIPFDEIVEVTRATFEAVEKSV